MEFFTPFDHTAPSEEPPRAADSGSTSPALQRALVSTTLAVAHAYGFDFPTYLALPNDTRDQLLNCLISAVDQATMKRGSPVLTF